MGQCCLQASAVFKAGMIAYQPTINLKWTDGLVGRLLKTGMATTPKP
jgi:hypothetical protein